MASEKLSPDKKRTRPARTKTFCEFFAGIGLVREGLSALGWRCIYANDIDSKKQQMYELRYGSRNHFHLGDVWNTKEVLSRIRESPFLATASFPCIDLSLAGHWRGFEGNHSSTFFGFAKVLKKLKRRPRLVMLENVAGLITSREGKDFEAVVRSLAELGYWIDSFVIDAKHFVPQSRPRVFVIGVHKSLKNAPTIRRSPLDWIADGWMQLVHRSPRNLRPLKLIRLMESIELPTGWAAFRLPQPNMHNRNVAEYIDLDETQEWWDAQAVLKHYEMMSDRHREIVDHKMKNGHTFVGTIFRRKRHGKTRAEVRFDGIAGCLRTPRGGSAKQIIITVDPGRLRMRWMSPREYARLQGAEEFPLTGNRNQDLFGFGDAVCVPVIRWIDQHVLTPVFKAAIAQERNSRG